VFKQQDQNLKRLVVKFDLHASPAQLARTQVNLKNAEPNTFWNCAGVHRGCGMTSLPQ
jgi:hypothetical protein